MQCHVLLQRAIVTVVQCISGAVRRLRGPSLARERMTRRKCLQLLLFVSSWRQRATACAEQSTRRLSPKADSRRGGDRTTRGAALRGCGDRAKHRASDSFNPTRSRSLLHVMA